MFKRKINNRKTNIITKQYTRLTINVQCIVKNAKFKTKVTAISKSHTQRRARLQRQLQEVQKMSQNCCRYLLKKEPTLLLLLEKMAQERILKRCHNIIIKNLEKMAQYHYKES